MLVHFVIDPNKSIQEVLEQMLNELAKHFHDLELIAASEQVGAKTVQEGKRKAGEQWAFGQCKQFVQSIKPEAR